MPQMAKHADKLAVVRSMTTAKVAGHMEGCKEFFKGYRFNSPLTFPGYRLGRRPISGAPIARNCRLTCSCPAPTCRTLSPAPAFCTSATRPWKLGTKSLGENVAAPGRRVRALEPSPGVDGNRLHARQRLRASLNHTPAAETPLADAVNSYYENAFDLLTSPRVQATLDVAGESDKTLDRYGRDHRGLCYLLGRKLIETGVRFVSVTVIQPPDLVGRPNYGQPRGVFLNWDHHEGIYANGPCGGPQGMSNQERYGLPHPVMMPSLDRSLSALLEDMHVRGLLDETLVCFITEMGRTPHINKWQGRDHWGRATVDRLCRRRRARRADHWRHRSPRGRRDRPALHAVRLRRNDLSQAGHRYRAAARACPTDARSISPKGAGRFASCFEFARLKSRFCQMAAAARRLSAARYSYRDTYDELELPFRCFRRHVCRGGRKSASLRRLTQTFRQAKCSINRCSGKLTQLSIAAAKHTSSS